MFPRTLEHAACTHARVKALASVPSVTESDEASNTYPALCVCVCVCGRKNDKTTPVVTARNRTSKRFPRAGFTHAFHARLSCTQDLHACLPRTVCTRALHARFSPHAFRRTLHHTLVTARFSPHAFHRTLFIAQFQQPHNSFSNLTTA